MMTDLSSAHSALADRLSAAARLGISRAFSLAFRGQMDEAVGQLVVPEPRTQSAETDEFAFGLVRARLLNLDGRPDEAAGVLDTLVDRFKENLTGNDRAILEQARIDAGFHSEALDNWDSERHYEEMDRRRIAQVVLREDDIFYRAASHAEKDRHADAFPLYAGALSEAYRRFHWRGVCEAAKQLAMELVTLKSPDEAAFVAMLSENQSTLAKVAEALRMGNDAGRIGLASAKLIETANLRDHVLAAATFVKHLDDAVPDEHVGPWLARFRPFLRSGLVPAQAGMHHRRLADAARDAATVLLVDGHSGDADDVIGEVVSSPIWQTNGIFRHQYADLLLAAACVATERGCRTLVDVIVAQLAVGRHEDAENCLRLLGECCERYPGLKAVVRERLYHQGPPADEFLCRAAPLFDASASSHDPDELAIQAADGIRALVHRQVPGGTATVMIGGPEAILILLREGRARLKPESVRALVKAGLDIIQDEGNLNRQCPGRDWQRFIASRMWRLGRLASCSAFPGRRVAIGRGLRLGSACVSRRCRIPIERTKSSIS